jgi:hypothetical protein
MYQHGGIGISDDKPALMLSRSVGEVLKLAGQFRRH